jgi:hypothetical protein
MGNFGFWTGIRAGQKAASKFTNRQHHAISIIAGILLALLIAAGLLILFGVADIV